MKNLQALYDPSLKFVAIVIFLSLFNKAQLSKIIDPLVLTFQQSLKYYLFNKDNPQKYTTNPSPDFSTKPNNFFLFLSKIPPF
jgi:hypothetical protein